MLSELNFIFLLTALISCSPHQHFFFFFAHTETRRVFLLLFSLLFLPVFIIWWLIHGHHKWRRRCRSAVDGGERAAGFLGVLVIGAELPSTERIIGFYARARKDSRDGWRFLQFQILTTTRARTLLSKPFRDFLLLMGVHFFPAFLTSVVAFVSVVTSVGR